ncbi:nucleotidyltransferase domain-containing protein [Methanococcoides sp. SA1]|nr:nucleotidyltransferase domain-containing protein [Methanococcoides sp. SA1]
MKVRLGNHIKDEITDVFKKFPQIKKAILYGSRAMETNKNGADIDLTILGENLNLSLLNKLENELDNLNLPYTFDLSILNQITNENLIDHINRHGKDFYVK